MHDGRTTRRWLLLAAAALAALAGGCKKAKSDTGTAVVTVTSPDPDASAIARVTLTVKPEAGRDFQPLISIDLERGDGAWSGRLSVPAGAARRFEVVAYDAGGAELFRGAASCDVTKGGSSSISIVLSGMYGGKPIILSVVNPQSTVAPGGLTTVSVVATDPAGGDLGYQWSATCGAFAAPTHASSTWTAPATEAACQLAIAVSNASGTTTGYSNVSVRTIDLCADVTCPAASDGCHVAGACLPSTGQCSAEMAKTCPPASDACHVAGNCQPSTGQCSAETAKTCPPASDLCHAAGTCQPSTGQCSAATAVACPPASDACHVAGSCQPSTGQCSAETAVACPAASDACHVAGSCEPSTGLCTAETAKVCSLGICDLNDGQCKEDRCVGVTCPPASDLCHVAGTCNLDTGQCSAQTAKTCPPASDRCHTAGTCSLVSGLCSAEVATVCPTGQACDVGDGQCKVRVPMPVFERADGALVGAQALGVGANGTIYRAGAISQAFDFGSGTVDGAGTVDMWLGAFDATAGLPARWVGSWVYNSNQPVVALAVGPRRVALIDTFVGSIDLGGGHTATNPYAEVPMPFVAVFDPATATASRPPTATYLRGVLMYTSAGGGALNKIAAHPTQDRFAICGLAQDFQVTDLGITTPAGGGKDLVVAVIDETASNGIAWARQIGGTGDQSCAAVAFDQNGDVVLTGNYQGVLDFGAGALPAPVAPSQRIYVAKLNGGTGATLQAVSFGAASGSGINLATAIAVMPNDDVVVGGNVRGRITMGTRTLVGSGTAYTDGFLAVLSGADLSSVAAGWPVRIGGSNAADAINAVAVDGAGQIWATGYMSGTTVFPGTDGFQVAQLTSLGAQDAYVLRLSPAGAVTFQASYGDAGGYNQSGTVLAASGNAMYLGGTYGGAIDIGTLPELTSSSGTDIRYFLVRFQ